MRTPSIITANQNTKRTGHYITDTFDNRTFAPGLELWEPDEEFIKRFSSSGTLLEEYACSAVGLTEALADAVATNIVLLPICSITGDFEVPYGVILKGDSRKGCVLLGTIQLNDLSILENLTVDNNTTGETDPTVGVLGPEDGYNIVDPLIPATAYMYSVTVDVGSTAGPAYAVQLTCGGVTAYDAELLALEGSDGYAAFVTYGALWQYGGRAVGTISGLPYYLDV